MLAYSAIGTVAPALRRQGLKVPDVDRPTSVSRKQVLEAAERPVGD